jgi:transcriptional regulator with XRE-family HTH domain
MNTLFGQFVKKLRSDKRLGLREFCIASDFDPSNWSKIERGVLTPPQDDGILSRIAAVLGIPENSKDRETLFDYASIDAGKIPPYVMNDEDLMKRLPLFFRTASGKKPTVEELEKLAEILKSS